jgi:hypothetical protein
MIFRRTTPNNHYRSLRLLSEGGRWELGFSPYHHGMRLRMGLTGRPPNLMDFCLGRDGGIFAPVLLAVLRRLQELDETSTPEMIDSVLPWAGTRPNMAVHLPELLKTENPISAV